MPITDPIKRKEYQKKYHEAWSKTYKGMKSRRISMWKTNGLKSNNYEEIYERYLNTEICDICNIKLCTKGESTNNNFKCMDHDHSTGLFRNIICNNCNNERWK